MGVVNEAEDLSLGRHVALKFLPESRCIVWSRAIKGELPVELGEDGLSFLAGPACDEALAILAGAVCKFNYR